jgi:hypothetical protein
MAVESYQHWQGEADRGTIVIRKKINRIVLPENAEGALKNHVYTRAQDEYGQPLMAYVEVPYDPREPKHQYPKMLFHPDYHKEPPPNLNHFKETKDWDAAMRAWELKYNRTQVAENEKHEKRLLQKGWLANPPVVATLEAPQSEEI